MDRAAVAALLIAAVTAAAFAYRSRRPGTPTQIDPDDFGLATVNGNAVTGFTGPYCLPCQEWTAALGEIGIEPAFVDISARPDLARRYAISHAPWIALVDVSSGSVLREWHHSPRPEDIAVVREAVGHP